MKERRFHPGLRQEDLCDPKPAVDRPGDGGGEHVGSSPAGETGGFGVDVRDRARIRIERRQRDHILAQGRISEWSRHDLEAARQSVLEMRADARRRA
jgi:hypothetical protein